MNNETKDYIKKFSIEQMKKISSKEDRIKKLIELRNELKEELKSITTQEDMKELEDMFNELKDIIEKGNGELKRILEA